jgi:phosphomannomutase
MTDRHTFDPSVLRAYDIRGVVGETLGEADAYAVGRGFGTVVARRGESPVVAVGYDGRLSSPALEQALCRGLSAAGIEVLRIGRGPTPMLYYAVRVLGTGGGVMVTGSHNPPDFNGFKMMLGTGPFFGDDIQALGRMVAEGDLASGIGSVRDRPVDEQYVDRLLENVSASSSLAVAWDAGNGAGGEIMARITARLPGRHILLNAEIDGRFPVHHPDPTVEANLQQLRDTVAREGCDLGIALDGDADRIGAVDSRGRVIWADQLMVLFARAVLERMPGATIIADVKASQVLFDEIERAGGVPCMWKTGHSLIKAKMAETGAPLAGEMSGHVFFADRYYGYDDALYAAVRLIELVGTLPDGLAGFVDGLPKVVNTPELRFACPDDRKTEVVDAVTRSLAAAGARVNTVDGVRVQTDDGWWLLRSSNTQPVLVARCEARSPEGLERLKQEVAERLRESGLEPPSF